VTELLKLLPVLGKTLHAPHEVQRAHAQCDGLPGQVQLMLETMPRPTQAQMQLAIELAMEGPATVGELAQRLGVTAPAVSLLVDRMAEHGLLERSRDTEDRRVVWVRLTPVAQTIADAMLGIWRGQVASFLDQVPEAEREAFVRNVALMARVLAQAGEGRPVRTA
jgi:DNA-binding MarR family transcriptional regulator